MTGLENSVKGTAFYKNENGEYKELGTLKSTSEEIENIAEYKNINTNMEVEGEVKFTITDKENIRKLKQLFKTDKQKKAEKRLNRKSFRNFIKRK